jgi:hypothetical protein
MVLRNVAAVLWNLAWFLRIALVAGVFVVAGASGSPGATRVAAGLVLVVVAGAAWWFGRDLPRAARPAVGAALRQDRPLRFTWAALGVCVAVFLAVALTGVAVLAALVWLTLALLAVVAVVVGRSRRRRR